MRQKLLIANWKSNPANLRAAVGLAHAEDLKSVVIAPPFSFLGEVGKVLRSAALGAQDAFWENEGPYTGEEGPTALKHLGVRHVILGHSERRHFLKETDIMVAQKTKRVLTEKLIPVCCVGESFSVRRKGEKAAWHFVERQVSTILKPLHISKFAHHPHLIFAYEPVWAISTSGMGLVATPENAAVMISKIKSFAKRKIPRVTIECFYGGSVDSKNIAAFLECPEIDGALVGGASLRPTEFRRMAVIAGKIGSKK
ncbi:MAG: triose-phosphate isomerase [Patescibacteria group bacterium]